MQINTSLASAPLAARRPAAASAPVVEQQSSDSVTLSYSNNSFKGGAAFGAMGLIPLVGVASNFGIGAQAGFNDHKAASNFAGAGVVANLAGTVTLAGGLLFGSGTATNLGLGLLGVSGLAGAVAGFVAS